MRINGKSETHSSRYPMDQRRALVQAEGITLDGERAKIVGTQLDFAVIKTRNGASVEFAWPTVARVVAAGGAFKS